MVKRVVILSAVAIAGFALGRIAVRGAMNALLGGTLFGGDIL